MAGDYVVYINGYPWIATTNTTTQRTYTYDEVLEIDGDPRRVTLTRPSGYQILTVTLASVAPDLIYAL